MSHPACSSTLQAAHCDAAFSLLDMVEFSEPPVYAESLRPSWGFCGLLLVLLFLLCCVRFTPPWRR